jgi:DNA repair exonuclease SbcCD ATPase subunit
LVIFYYFKKELKKIKENEILQKNEEGNIKNEIIQKNEEISKLEKEINEIIKDGLKLKEKFTKEMKDKEDEIEMINNKNNEHLINFEKIKNENEGLMKMHEMDIQELNNKITQLSNHHENEKIKNEEQSILIKNLENEHEENIENLENLLKSENNSILTKLNNAILEKNSLDDDYLKIKNDLVVSNTLVSNLSEKILYYSNCLFHNHLIIHFFNKYHDFSNKFSIVSINLFLFFKKFKFFVNNNFNNFIILDFIDNNNLIHFDYNVFFF